MNGQAIKKLREFLKLTQTELAAKLGVNQVTVNRWERHKSKPSKLALRQLNRLASRGH